MGGIKETGMGVRVGGKIKTEIERVDVGWHGCGVAGIGLNVCVRVCVLGGGEIWAWGRERLREGTGQGGRERVWYESGLLVCLNEWEVGRSELGGKGGRSGRVDDGGTGWGGREGI